MSTKKREKLFKLSVIGDSHAGKTCLLTRYTDNQFMKNYCTTIGCDFRVKSMEVEGERIRMQLWDTAGQERYRAISACFYKGTHCFIICYDVTNKSSFENIDKWVNDINNYPETKGILKVLVGCKVDLQSKRQVSKEEGMKKAKELEMNFYETSALTDEGVRVLFEDIGKMLARIKPEAPEKKEAPEKEESSKKIAIQKKRSVISSGCPCQ